MTTATLTRPAVDTDHRCGQIRIQAPMHRCTLPAGHATVLVHVCPCGEWWDDRQTMQDDLVAWLDANGRLGA
jgi:hypothetical protein